VLSKIYYHLQDYNESMVFALGAGELFDIEEPEDPKEQLGEYEKTIIAKCIDTYIALCAMHNPPTPASKTASGNAEFNDTFTGAKGSTAAAVSSTSPTTPFSQSALPSKSLLSRDFTNTWDSSAPGGGNAGVAGAHPHPLTLSNNVKRSLQRVARQLFEQCYKKHQYKQVVGIAVEARNMDLLREVIVIHPRYLHERHPGTWPTERDFAPHFGASERHPQP
jgi:26S proteasome regulatory subunit N2